MVFCMIFTSCWNSREIDELSIATALGIDKSKEGYIVTVQLIKPGEIAKEKTGKSAPVITYRTYGKTVYEAIRKLTLETPRRIYLSHLRLVVFGEELAEEDGIGKVMDFISRDHEVRTDFYITVSRGTKAEKLLNILTPLEQIPANKIFSALETSANEWAPTKHIQLYELVHSLVSEGKEPVLTGIIIKGDPEIGMDISNLEKVDVPTTVQIRYLAVFKKDKLVEWLNEEESVGYNHITGGVKSTIVTIPWLQGGKIGIELVRTKSKVSGRMEYGKPKIEIEYRVEANIGDVECEVDLLEEDNIRRIEEILEEEIKRKMNSAVEKAKNLKSDIFGFGEVIHRSVPKAWKELKNNWDSEFQDLNVGIKVTAKVRRLGTTTGSLKQNIKE